MTKDIKNIGLSIKTRLWNIAADNKRDKNDNQMYQLVAIRYIQERLLYRLCRSRFCNKFYLKGGALLYAYDLFRARRWLVVFHCSCQPCQMVSRIGSNSRRQTCKGKGTIGQEHSLARFLFVPIACINNVEKTSLIIAYFVDGGPI